MSSDFKCEVEVERGVSEGLNARYCGALASRILRAATSALSQGKGLTKRVVRASLRALRTRPALTCICVLFASGFALIARDTAVLLEARRNKGLVTSSRAPEIYARTLREYANGGPRVNELVATIPDGSPVQKIGALYRRLLHDWVYRIETSKFWAIPTGDLMAPADEYVRNGLSGDCVGYSIVFAAATDRLLRLPWRVVTTRGRDGPGHAFPEVLLGPAGSPDVNALINELKSEFGVPPVVEADSEGAAWMSMDRDIKARFPNHECEIYSDGRLKCK